MKLIHQVKVSRVQTKEMGFGISYGCHTSLFVVRLNVSRCIPLPCSQQAANASPFPQNAQKFNWLLVTGARGHIFIKCKSIKQGAKPFQVACTQSIIEIPIQKKFTWKRLLGKGFFFPGKGTCLLEHLHSLFLRLKFSTLIDLFSSSRVERQQKGT